MQILKTFIDSTGHRHKVGAAVPKEWDKATLAHYQHHGMVGDEASTAKTVAKPRKSVGPTEKKPAAPTETQQVAPGAPPTEPIDTTDGPSVDSGAAPADEQVAE